MKTTIIPITEENIGHASVAGAKFGMPRSPGWFRRCLFDPTVEDLTTDRIRGHMSVDENGDVKAIQVYYYQPCYFCQTKFLASTGALMGAEAKYGEELLCVIDSNKETRTAAKLGFGNCVAGSRSAKVNRVVNKMREPPYRPLDSHMCISDWSTFPLAILGRLHLRSRVLRFLVYKSFRPVFLLKYAVSHFVGCMCGYEIVRHDDFNDARFDDFWQRFLAANDGIISSREPRRLQWLFNDSIHARKVHLVAAERGGRIDGYVLIRECAGCELPPRMFEIIDICAVDNNAKCLLALCRSAMNVAGLNGGIKLFFSGSMPNQEAWLDPLFPFKVKMGNAQFMYVTKDKDIMESLTQNKGWFFGPFDGERCMGHGGYIDL